MAILYLCFRVSLVQGFGLARDSGAVFLGHVKYKSLDYACIQKKCSIFVASLYPTIEQNTFMKLKKDLSLFAQTAWMLSGAGRVAAVLLVMIFSMTAQTAWAQSNIVTKDNFNSFFDGSGKLLETVEFNELIFQGEFSNLVETIIISDKITLTGNDAVLNNMALRITGDDVTVTGFTLNEDGADFTNNDGAAIYVSGFFVTLDKVSVTYNAPNEVEAKAIFADDADNFQLINSEITFTGADPGEYHYRGLEVRNSDAAKIDNNTISAEYPAFPVDWGGIGIGTNLVLAVGIQGGDNVKFTNNTVNVNTNGGVGYYPTIDAVMIHSTDDILIKGNKITHIDTTTEDGTRYYYSLDIYSTTGTVEANDIILNTTTNVDRTGAYPIQLTGPFEVTVKDNNITAVSKGTVAGIYSTNWNGAGDLTVENNIIDVTGYVTTDNYTLVAGIEAEIDVFKASNNTITVANGADYDDANKVIGVGIGYPYYSSVTSVDIIDNNITVDGKYAVYYEEAVNTNVTGNVLYAHELTCDDAVYIGSGDNNTVKNNYPFNLTEDGITDEIAEVIKGKAAVFKRTFTKDVVSTLCLPFPMTSVSGGTLYEFTDVNYDASANGGAGAWVADFNESVAPTKESPTIAGTPYLFMADDDCKVIFDGIVPDDFDGNAGTSEANHAGGGTWTFHGTYTTLTYGTNLDGAVYGFAGAAYDGGSYSVSPGDFVMALENATVSAFRCFLTYNGASLARSVTGATNGLPSRIIVRLIGLTGQTTAIGTMDTRTGEVRLDGNGWYTLDGRKLAGQPTKEGIYVNKGRKLVVK